MQTILRACYAKPLALSLVVTLLALTSMAAPAEAMFIPAGGTGAAPAPSGISPERATDLAKVESALESKVVRQRLVDYGLSPDEARARVTALSDQQLHDLAAHADAVQAGGDPVDFLIGVIIVVLLVVVLVDLLQGRIVVK